jgi:hypothetical protein
MCSRPWLGKFGVSLKPKISEGIDSGVWVLRAAARLLRIKEREVCTMIQPGSPAVLPPDIALTKANKAFQPATLGENASPVSQEFEAVLLRQIVETMLPKDNAGLFGGAVSGSICRSMFADGIAGELSKGDILGLSGILNGAIGQEQTKR